MTREELKNYKKNRELLTVYRYQLREMNTTDAGLDNSVIMDYTKGFARPQSIVGFDHKKYTEILKKCLEKEKAVKEVEDFINNIKDDDLAKFCFYEYYIKGTSWEDVSAKIGSSTGEQYPRRTICGSYLKKHKIE